MRNLFSRMLHHHHDHHDHHGRSARHDCIGRHHGGRGFGPFGKGMSGEFGLGGIGRGRKLGSSELQLLILSLLADKPSHGYEIIKALDERSNGFYAPSPGMVYPALTYLDELGQARVEVEGAKKLYHITDEGRSYLEENRAAVDAILAQFAYIGERMDQVRDLFSRTGSRETEGESDRGFWDRHRLPRALHEARSELKKALRGKMDGSPEEHARIAAILLAAAKAIRGE